MKTNNNLIELKNIDLTYGYGNKKVKILHNISLDIQKNDIFGIIGESGSGKSTIAKAIMGIEKISDGAILYDGCLLRGKKKYIQNVQKTLYKTIMLYKLNLQKIVVLLEKLYKNNNKIIETKIKEYIDKIIVLIFRLNKCNEKINNYSFSFSSPYKNYSQTKASIKESLQYFSNLNNSIIVNRDNLEKIISIANNNFFYDFNINDNNITPLKKTPTKQTKKSIQLIMQDPSLSLNERMKIEDIIAEGIDNFGLKSFSIEEKQKYMDDTGAIKVNYKKMKKYMIKKMFKKINLPELLLQRFPHQLSGGQKQRVSIGRSLLLNPNLLIADEPISSLDVSIRAQILNLLKQLQKEYDTTYIFIAHDLSVVRNFCTKIAIVYKGRIVEYGETEEIFKKPTHPYTNILLSSAPIGELDIVEKKKDLKKYYEKLVEFETNKSNLYKTTKVGENHYVLTFEK